MINVLYKRELEYLFASVELLLPQNLNNKLSEVYDAIFVSEKEKEFLLLFEFYHNVSEEIAIQILDFLIEYDVERFSIEDYFMFLRNKTKSEFLSRFLRESEDVVKNMIASEKERIFFYQKNKNHFKNYFVVDLIVNRTDLFLETYLSFVHSLETNIAERYLQDNSVKLNMWIEKMTDELQKKAPLDFSEEIMGKKFHNRGPYKAYYFMPSLFLPMKCCRWYEERQFLVVNILCQSDEVEEEIILGQVKSLSDKTRYKILLLLQKNENLSGVKIATKLRLATSTVSHHMTELKECGLVNEERDGNTKYYSINTRTMKNCIETLEKAFLH